MTTEQSFVDADQPIAQNTIDKVNTMGMDNLNDKVNINVGDGGSGGMGMAALIAAMNSGGGDNNLPGLIAALGNNNRGMDPGIAAMLANRGNDGMNNLWPIILLALLGRGRGGLLGGDGGDCGPIAANGLNPAQAAMLQTLLEGQSALRAEGPQNTLRAQGEILQALSAQSLGIQQGFASTGDKVQNALLAELAAISSAKDATQNGVALLARDICDVKAAVLAEGCAGRETTMAAESRILSRIDRSEIDELRARADRAERNLEITSLRAQVEQNQTVNVTTAANAQQSQGQFQIQGLLNEVRACREEVARVHQVAQAANQNIIAGNLGAVTTGAQSSTPTNINSRGN